MCEKIKLFIDAGKEKDESGVLGFEDFMSSLKSPLSPKKPWQERDNNFNRGDTDGQFSIGQTVRIRIGPLKGYLCRVLAIRRADITVKLDSQQKVHTVKCEHLSEVRTKSSNVLLIRLDGWRRMHQQGVMGVILDSLVLRMMLNMMMLGGAKWLQIQIHPGVHQRHQITMIKQQIRNLAQEDKG